MIKYSINLTLQFKRELEEIYNYIFFSLSSPKAATNLYLKIKNSILTLDLFPERYSKISVTNFQKHNLRKLVIDNYIVIYDIDSMKYQVFILHIFHCKQDYLRYI